MRNSKVFYRLALLFLLCRALIAEPRAELNPSLDSLPDGEYVPVVYDLKTNDLYWMKPRPHIRNGIHSIIVAAITERTYGEINNTRQEGRFLAGGFIKSEGNVLNFHGRNSFYSNTFNIWQEEAKYGIMPETSRTKFLDALRVAFPQAEFRANIEPFKPGEYSVDQQRKLADAFAYGWRNQVEGYNSLAARKKAMENIAVLKFASMCTSK